MAVTSEHLAYEIDAATRIATVVYIGELGDNEVLSFYASLMAHYPDAPNYDYLLDMRYTDWRASPSCAKGGSRPTCGRSRRYGRV